MSAPSLIPVASAHIDGALYHGDSGTLFAEKLVELGAKVAIRATLNVGGLDLMGCSKVNLPPHEREMAGRMMRAYIALGCEPTWTCAPYQAGHRPALGSDVAWGESNAVVFCNSVLGARTNRYGDFLDIACAISGRAPNYGLHLAENRRATFAVDVSALPAALLTSEIAFPVLGSLFGGSPGPRSALSPASRRIRARTPESLRRGGGLDRRRRAVSYSGRDARSAGHGSRDWRRAAARDHQGERGHVQRRRSAASPPPSVQTISTPSPSAARTCRGRSSKSWRR